MNKSSPPLMSTSTLDLTVQRFTIRKPVISMVGDARQTTSNKMAYRH